MFINHQLSVVVAVYNRWLVNKYYRSVLDSRKSRFEVV